jgi:hypothetical protein
VVNIDQYLPSPSSNLLPTLLYPQPFPPSSLRRRDPHLEALGLLPDLHDVLAAQLALPPLVVLLLVGELRLVLQAGQVGALPLDVVEACAAGLVSPVTCSSTPQLDGREISCTNNDARRKAATDFVG